MRLRHAEPLGMMVHQVGEILNRATDAFREHDRHVVRRLHEQHLERVVDRDGRAGREPHLDRRLRHRVGRNGEQLVERDPAFLDRA
jgi:hypothetical protein